MSELKITKGEAIIGGKTSNRVLVNDFIIASVDGIGWTQAIENTMFIAEAFNVANETGLTPKQLLEQRDQLLDVLRHIASHDVKVTADTALDCIFLAGEAIAKAEGRS